MPYNSVKGNLPYERASKLGHISVINSEWVKSLVESFEDPEIKEIETELKEGWNKLEEFDKPLKKIWVVDGSLQRVSNHIAAKRMNPISELGFIKVGLLRIDWNNINKLDKYNPHPLELRDIMNDSAIFHSTVLPLKNIRANKFNNSDAVRNIIFESIKQDENGAFLETLKWLLYKKWRAEKLNSPEFECPKCNNIIKNGMSYDAERIKCIHKECKTEIFITDVLGFHLDMSDDGSNDSIVTSYMSIMEHIMLFTPIRLLWEHKDKTEISKTLFIKDGPLSLNSQYSKLIPNIRDFIKYSVDQDREVDIIGCEKSGGIFEHFNSIEAFIEPKIDKTTLKCEEEYISYKLLTHEYIRKNIQRRDKSKNIYGKRTNWGEKLLVKVDSRTTLVLNIPVYEYKEDEKAPYLLDAIGIKKILSSLKGIISSRYEGALLPIELANGIASLSSYPSAKILSDFVSDIRKK